MCAKKRRWKSQREKKESESDKQYISTTNTIILAKTLCTNNGLVAWKLESKNTVQIQCAQIFNIFSTNNVILPLPHCEMRGTVEAADRVAAGKR